MLYIKKYIMKFTKFKDIPQFTQNANYHVHHAIKRLDWAINTYINDYGLELCPDFQRGHVWTEKQQIAYVEYLLRGGMSGREIYLNHTKWNNTKDKNDGEFVCVDGLQRITAC